jgi:hypothetical protein
MRIRPTQCGRPDRGRLLIAALNTDASSLAAPQVGPALATGPVRPSAGSWLTDADGRVMAAARTVPSAGRGHTEGLVVQFGHLSP